MFKPKKLEWELVVGGMEYFYYTADLMGHVYEISCVGCGKIRLDIAVDGDYIPEYFQYHALLSNAKAAAQADYDAWYAKGGEEDNELLVALASALYALKTVDRRTFDERTDFSRDIHGIVHGTCEKVREAIAKAKGEA